MPDKLSVAVLLDSYLPDKRVERELKSLSLFGYKVYLFCFGSKGKYKVDGIKITEYKPTYFESKAIAMAVDLPFYHWSLKSKVNRFIEEVNPDIIHVHDITLAGLAFRLKKSAKLVLDLHENRPEIMKDYPHLHRFPGKYVINPAKWREAEVEYVREADAVVVVTEEAKEGYMVINPNVAVVPNTIERSEIEKVRIDQEVVNRFKGRFVLTYIGDIGLRRGILDVLKAVNILRSRIENITLILVGDSSDRHIYEDFIASNNLEEYVLLEGHQPHDNLFSYIAVASICLCPIIRNKHHDTTYANKIFQYMGMGKAQIVSDCPAQQRVIEDSNSGLVYQSGNPHQLADGILRLYDNESLRRSMEINAKAAFEQTYNWEKMQDNLINMYESLSDK